MCQREVVLTIENEGKMTFSIVLTSKIRMNFKEKFIEFNDVYHETVAFAYSFDIFFNTSLDALSFFRKIKGFIGVPRITGCMTAFDKMRRRLLDEDGDDCDKHDDDLEKYFARQNWFDYEPSENTSCSWKKPHIFHPTALKREMEGWYNQIGGFCRQHGKVADSHDEYKQVEYYSILNDCDLLDALNRVDASLEDAATMLEKPFDVPHFYRNGGPYSSAKWFVQPIRNRNVAEQLAIANVVEQSRESIGNISNWPYIGYDSQPIWCYVAGFQRDQRTNTISSRVLTPWLIALPLSIMHNVGKITVFRTLAMKPDFGANGDMWLPKRVIVAFTETIQGLPGSKLPFCRWIRVTDNDKVHWALAMSSCENEFPLTNVVGDNKFNDLSSQKLLVETTGVYFSLNQGFQYENVPVSVKFTVNDIGDRSIFFQSNDSINDSLYSRSIHLSKNTSRIYCFGQELVVWDVDNHRSHDNINDNSKSTNTSFICSVRFPSEENCFEFYMKIKSFPGSLGVTLKSVNTVAMISYLPARRSIFDRFEEKKICKFSLSFKEIDENFKRFFKTSSQFPQAKWVAVEAYSKINDDDILQDVWSHRVGMLCRKSFQFLFMTPWNQPHVMWNGKSSVDNVKFIEPALEFFDNPEFYYQQLFKFRHQMLRMDVRGGEKFHIKGAPRCFGQVRSTWLFHIHENNSISLGIVMFPWLIFDFKGIFAFTTQILEKHGTDWRLFEAVIVCTQPCPTPKEGIFTNGSKERWLRLIEIDCRSDIGTFAPRNAQVSWGLAYWEEDDTEDEERIDDNDESNIE